MVIRIWMEFLGKNDSFKIKIIQNNFIFKIILELVLGIYIIIL